MSWSKFTDEANNDPVLAALSEDAAHSIINILTLTLFADNDQGFMEQMEFETLLHKLPWFEGKQGKVTEYTEQALAKAGKVHDKAAFDAVLAEAQGLLTSPEVRRKVFQMATLLACCDHDLHPNERQALGWLATAFGLDDAEVQATLKAAMS